MTIMTPLFSHHRPPPANPPPCPPPWSELKVSWRTDEAVRVRALDRLAAVDLLRQGVMQASKRQRPIAPDRPPGHLGLDNLARLLEFRVGSIWHLSTSHSHPGVGGALLLLLVVVLALQPSLAGWAHNCATASTVSLLYS